MAEMSYITRATPVAVVLAIVLAGPAAFAQTTATKKSAPAKAAAAKTAVAVYQTPTCGCCGKWVEHMQANGFATTVTDLPDLAETKAKHRVPAQLQSCHTSVVGGYVIEGHVPAEDIRRLLREKPAILGLAAPGMPAGSPGMDVPHSPAFDVIAFDKDGHTRVFATHPAR
jgi:hypothetical protein